MSILVLGGTGAMGVPLVKLLVERGDEVFVTSRRKCEDTVNVHYLCGNAHEEQFFSSLLATNWDAIVDFMVYNIELLY